MISTSAGKPMVMSDTQQATSNTGGLATRKIWLPKLLYDAVPYFYLVSGIAAFFATLYISEWFWVLPHYSLFAVACVHLGIMVYRRRRARNPDSSVSELP